MPVANSTCFDECSNQCFKQHWCLCATPLTSFSFLLSNYRLGKGHFQTQSGWQITEKCLLKTTSFKRKVPPDTWHSPWACPDTTGWWDWPAQCPARCAPEHQTWPDTVLEHRAAAILKVSWHFTSVHSLSGQHLLLIIWVSLYANDIVMKNEHSLHNQIHGRLVTTAHNEEAFRSRVTQVMTRKRPLSIQQWLLFIREH